jgi:hypothetical protein
MKYSLNKSYDLSSLATPPDHNFIENDFDLVLKLMERHSDVEGDFTIEEYPRFHQLFCH